MDHEERRGFRNGSYGRTGGISNHDLCALFTLENQDVTNGISYFEPKMKKEGDDERFSG